MRSSTVAVVQDEVAPDLAAGLRRTAELTAQAAAAGARLVVFPETWLPGYPVWLDVCRDVALWDHTPVKRVFARMADESVVVDGDSGHALAEIARRNGVTLVIGVTERVAAGVGRGTLYNSLLIYGDSGSFSTTIASSCRRTPSEWCGAPATRRGCEPWKRRSDASVD